MKQKAKTLIEAHQRLGVAAYGFISIISRALRIDFLLNKLAVLINKRT